MNKIERFLTFYNSKLKNLNYKEIRIASSFGKTTILVFGDDNKPPLFLIHGLNSAAPFAFETVSFLSDNYQVFAIDLLGEPNKSDFVRLNKKDASYGLWLLEVVAFFKIDKISFLGISFGAFPILKSLLMDDKKIKEIFLISPAGIINGSLWQTIFKFLIPMQKFKKTKKEIFLKKCLHQLYDEFDDTTLEYQKEVFLNFKMDFSVTPNFKKLELSSIKIPITIISSKKDFFVPGEKLKKRSEKHFSSLKKFVLLENSKHIANTSILETIFKELD